MGASKAKTPSKAKAASKAKGDMGVGLANEQLTALAAQLLSFREFPPLITRSGRNIKGDILAFVKGLRLSAGVIYFFREKLEELNLEVSWGHLLDDKQQYCSLECDVIIHSKGSWRTWNGGKQPIMEFKFVKVSKARAVISCKSILTSIDTEYPKEMKKFGVKKVFLFAECSSATNFTNLRKAAKKAGYADLCCLYLTGPQGFVEMNEHMWFDFGNKVLEAVL